MTGKHRRARGPDGPTVQGSNPRHVPRRRVTPAAVAVGVMLALFAPGVALAVFSSAPAARSASVTAGTIAAPGTFTATATGPTTANLSWTAPANLTGYTLSQTPGTLAGCSATPASGTTGCTATGLSASTAYTWTLHAVYNNWISSQIQASATTTGGSFATDLGNSVAACGTSSCTGPSVATTSGRGELIFIYVTGTTASTVSSVTGPFPSATQYAVEPFPTSGSFSYVYAYRATGNGTGPTAVTVNFSALSAGAAAWVDVVQLDAGESALSSCDSFTARGSGTSALATVSIQGPTHKKISFLGSTTGTFTTASGFSVIAGGGSAHFGTYARAPIQQDSTFPVSPSAPWGSISLEISP